MPRTLYAYILKDLLRVLLATAAVLVVVLGFGFAIKPISEGQLGPLALVKVVFYAMPGMLPMALPFASAFASTMVFFRMTGDNEVQAAAASGISYRQLLLPVLVLGIGMTCGVFFLSNWVVPRFWQQIERELQQDIVQILVGKIQRGEVIEQNNVLLYADAVEQREVTEVRQPGVPRPYSRLILEGVAVGQVQPVRRGVAADPDTPLLQASYTAARATVDLYRDPERNRIFLTMMLQDAAWNDPETGTLLSVDLQPIREQEIPNPFRQKPELMSLTDLQALADNPQRSPEIRHLQRDLVEKVAEQKLLNQIHDVLQKEKSIELIDAQGLVHRITCSDARREEHAIQLSGSPDQMLKIESGAQTRRARTGKLEVARNELEQEPRLTLELEHVLVRDNELRSLTIPLLRSRTPVKGELAQQDLKALREEARRAPEKSAVRLALNTINTRIASLQRQILSRLNERGATAMFCVLVLLLGAVMSMLLRHQPPLAIFFWSFMPAVLAFFCILQGQNMVEQMRLNPVLGLGMLWSGPAGLTLLTVFFHGRLSRN